MKYKLVIFDLDGTILNTLGDLCAASNAALQEFHLPEITLEQTQSYIGNGIRNLLLQASNYSEQIDSIVEFFKEYYWYHFNDFTKPYEGIQEVFQFCKDKGIRIGVLTNKIEEIALPLIEAHFPNTMDFVFGEIEGRTRKPNPEFLLSIIKRYGYTEKDVLYIGDSEVDILTCKNASIEGVFVSYGFRTKNQLLQHTNCIVDSALDIITCLGE